MGKVLALSLAILTVAAAGLAITVPGTDLYVPSVGHGVGQDVGGVRAQWRADVWVFNPNSLAATVDVFFLPRGQGNTNPESRRLTVNPGETRHLSDVVLTLFGRDSSYGALRVVADRPVVVTGANYDANVTVEAKERGAGTAGLFFSGTPADQAIGLNESTDVAGLDQDAAGTSGIWRSNLALVETSGNPVTLDVQRLDSAGNVLNSIPVTLLAREARQLDTVLTTIFATPGTNQRVRIRVTDGSGRVLATGIRIDNRTGDPSTVEAAGASRTGVWVCKLDKTNYDTPLTFTVSGNAVTSIDATVLVTDEDAGATCQGELLRLAQGLNPPVVLENGAFSFSVGGRSGALVASLQVQATVGATGGVSGQVTTTLTGAGPCSGSKTWPLVGARVAN